MSKIPKWVRNILIGIILNSLKNTSFVQKIVAKLKDKKTIVGRIGFAIFSCIAALKYYKPELPIDEGVEVLGMFFSWLLLEIGFSKSEIENIEAQGNKKFDPSQPLDIAGIHLPSPESIGIIIENAKKISSDEDK